MVVSDDAGLKPALAYLYALDNNSELTPSRTREFVFLCRRPGNMTLCTWTIHSFNQKLNCKVVWPYENSHPLTYLEDGFSSMNKENLESHIENFIKGPDMDEASAGLFVVGSSSFVYSMWRKFKDSPGLLMRSVVHEDSLGKEPTSGSELAFADFL